MVIEKGGWRGCKKTDKRSKEKNSKEKGGRRCVGEEEEEERWENTAQSFEK